MSNYGKHATISSDKLVQFFLFHKSGLCLDNTCIGSKCFYFLWNEYLERKKSRWWNDEFKHN